MKEGIDRWLEVQRVLKASSTVVNYVSKAVHVETKFGKRRIVDISKSDIELFQAQLLKQGLAPKTVNDIFTVVRGVWADAFGAGILKANPLDRISNVGSDVDLEHADPFSRAEIELIVKNEKTPVIINDYRGLVLFNNGGEIGIRTPSSESIGRFCPANTMFQPLPAASNGL